MRQDQAEAMQITWDSIRNYLCDAETYGSLSASMMNGTDCGEFSVDPETEAFDYGRRAGHAAIAALGFMRIKVIKHA